MILKSLSISNKSGIGNLLKYILKKDKVAYYLDDRYTEMEKPVRRPYYYIPGVHLNNDDKKYLLMEAGDGKILREFLAHSPDRNIHEYVKNYLLNNVAQNTQNKHPFIITHNIRNDSSVQEMTKSFQSIEASRIHKRSNQTAIQHTIISFNKKDTPNITDAMLRDITYKFIELRGENNAYVISKHDDRDCVHLHAAVSATMLNGLSSRQSKENFADLKLQIDSFLHAKYGKELSHSFPDHGKSKRLGIAPEKNIKRNERTTVRSSLQSCLGSIIKNSVSIGHFKTQLQEQGYSVYYRADRLTGIQCDNGLKFRFSRLIDVSELKALENQDKALTEMRTLRNQGRGTERTIHTNALKKEENVNPERSIEEGILKELADIRDSKDNEMERDKDQDSLDIEIEDYAEESGDCTAIENDNEEDTNNSANDLNVADEDIEN